MFLFAFIFSGCGTVRIQSLKAPDFSMKNYNVFLIRVYNDNLDNVKVLENRVQEILFKRGIKSAPNHRVLPPFKEYSQEEIQIAFDKYKIDALISIRINEYEVQSTNYDNDWRSASHIQYKYPIESVIEIIDLNDGEIKWKGDAFSNYTHNPYSQVSLDYIYTLAAEIDNTFEKDLLFR